MSLSEYNAENGRLHPYTIELLRDVARAKRVAGVNQRFGGILYATYGFKRSEVGTLTGQLLRFGVFATDTGAGLLVEWGARGVTALYRVIIGPTRSRDTDPRVSVLNA